MSRFSLNYLIILLILFAQIFGDQAFADQKYVMGEPVYDDEIGFCGKISDAKKLLRNVSNKANFVKLFNSLKGKKRCIYGSDVNHTPIRLRHENSNAVIMEIRYHASGEKYYALIYKDQLKGR